MLRQEGDPIGVLFSLLESNDTLVQKYAAISLGQLACNSSARLRLHERSALDKIMAVAHSSNTAHHSTNASGALHNHRATESLWTASAPPEVVAVCIFALSNLAACAEYHSAFVPHARVFVSWAEGNNKDIQKYAVLLLQNLVLEDTMALHCVQNGALSALIGILSRPNVPEDTKFHAFAALRSLAGDDDIKVQMMRSGLLTSLAQVSISLLHA